ncbi:MAG: hypothetical protein ACREM8_08045 [Vulcanimicrobiaceae bacterium]
MKNLPLIVAVVCFAIALLYWTGITPLGHHLKHGILFFGLGVLALVWRRFQSNAETTR